MDGVGVDLDRLFGELGEGGWFARGSVTEARLAVSSDGVHLAMSVDRTRPPSADVASILAEASAQVGARRDQPLRLTVRKAGWKRVATVALDVPGFGWSALGQPRGVDRSPAPVTGGDGWLDNSLVRVTINPNDGTFALGELSGLGRLVDGGDEGDTYNYSPPAVDTLIDQPQWVRTETLSKGPAVGTIRVIRGYVWRATTSSGHRVGARRVEVVSELELRAGEGFVRVETRFNNSSRDHRLRAHFPLPLPTDYSVAECAFASVRRGLVAQGGPHERGLPTFPARRWVSAGGLTVTHDRMLEYELLGNGTELALTLLRSTGMLSRPAPSYRPNSAGPHIPLSGSQMLGPQSVSYAITTSDVSGHRLADDTWLTLDVITAVGGGALGASGSHLGVSGAEVSSLRRVGQDLELRVWNPTDTDTVVQIPGRSGVIVDLRGNTIEKWKDSWPLGAAAIATIRVSPEQH